MRSRASFSKGDHVALGDQMIDAGHHVVKILSAPVGAIQIDESFAVAGRAADVRGEDGVAARDQQLRPRVDAVRPRAGGPAVNQENGGEMGAPRGAAGIVEAGFDFEAVEALVADDAERLERNPRPRLVEIGNFLRLAVVLPDPKLRRGGRSLADEARTVGARE